MFCFIWTFVELCGRWDVAKKYCRGPSGVSKLSVHTLINGAPKSIMLSIVLLWDVCATRTPAESFQIFHLKVDSNREPLRGGISPSRLAPEQIKNEFHAIFLRMVFSPDVSRACERSTNVNARLFPWITNEFNLSDVFASYYRFFLSAAVSLLAEHLNVRQILNSDENL